MTLARYSFQISERSIPCLTRETHEDMSKSEGETSFIMTRWIVRVGWSRKWGKERDQLWCEMYTGASLQACVWRCGYMCDWEVCAHVHIRVISHPGHFWSLRYYRHRCPMAVLWPTRPGLPGTVPGLRAKRPVSWKTHPSWADQRGKSVYLLFIDWSLRSSWWKWSRGTSNPSGQGMLHTYFFVCLIACSWLAGVHPDQLMC